MKRLLKTMIAAAALAGATGFAAVPAQAGISFNFSIGLPIPGAVAIDYGSGGYCDEWGCPDAYWDMPVYYGPVYYGGRWFQGPIYYRDYGGNRWYWVRGGWRRDEWRGPRPNWWKGNYRVGPALGYDYYRANGFRHDRDRYWRGNDWRPGRDWDRNRVHDWDRNHPNNKVRIDDKVRVDDRSNNNGGAMKGPGGAMSGPGGSMTGPSGGSMKGPGGSMSGPGGSMKGPGGSMSGPGGSMTGPSNGNASGEKPKNKDKNDPPGN
jgi:hypothetical protein